MLGRLIFSAIAFIPVLAVGCGLDWKMPVTHFEGVEDHGYVAYWEKIGEADLGGGLVVPVSIGFNSHRELSSPTLGKGWIVPLLESHVEPIDENSLNVIMPDGWTFLFYRNGNSETWRGNSGWMGETRDTLFTITAPCGWQIKFDQGKIQEIDGSGNRTLTYRYDGGVATEVDAGTRPLLRVESADGAPADIIVGDQKIDVTLAQRPRVVTEAGQTLIAGFDPSLNTLRWPGGRTESFTFAADADLHPTLEVSDDNLPKEKFTWDAETRQIISDGTWDYTLQKIGDHWRFDRTTPGGGSESYESDEARGVTTEKGADGKEIATYRFPNGPLTGRIRKIEQLDDGAANILYSASYYPSGRLMRETVYPDRVRTYAENGKLLKETVADDVVYEQTFDDQGRLIHLLNPSRQIEVKRVYDSQGGETTQVFKDGALFYTELVDQNNKLISFNEGDSQ